MRLHKCGAERWVHGGSRTFRGVLPLARATGRALAGRAVSLAPIAWPSCPPTADAFSSAYSNLAIFFASDDL